MPKLTKKLVEAIDPENADILLRDSELKGFICKITPKGKRVYMLYYRTKDGRERKPAIGVHGAITCDEARGIAKQWMSEVTNGGDPSQHKQITRKTLSLTQFAEKYMQDYARFKKKSGKAIDERLWRLHILPALGKLSLSAIAHADIAKLHRDMGDTPANANRVLALLKKAFNVAIEWGDLKTNVNPAARVKKYKETPKDRFLALDELTKLGDVVRLCEQEGQEMKSAILALRLLILTGCRRNEILELQWDWIDFIHSKIDFPDSKTGKKSIYLNPPTIELLNNTPRIEGNPYVCVGRDGSKHLVNLQKPWNRMRKRAGIPDVRLHDLRHSFASAAAAGGMSLFMISKLLGHKDQAVTQRYAHLIGDPMRLATESVGNTLAAAMNGTQAEIIPLHGGTNA